MGFDNYKFFAIKQIYANLEENESLYCRKHLIPTSCGVNEAVNHVNVTQTGH